MVWWPTPSGARAIEAEKRIDFQFLENHCACSCSAGWDLLPSMARPDTDAGPAANGMKITVGGYEKIGRAVAR